MGCTQGWTDRGPRLPRLPGGLDRLSVGVPLHRGVCGLPDTARWTEPVPAPARGGLCGLPRYAVVPDLTPHRGGDRLALECLEPLEPCPEPGGKPSPMDHGLEAAPLVETLAGQ
jgi:hypothetical protein